MGMDKGRTLMPCSINDLPCCLDQCNGVMTQVRMMEIVPRHYHRSCGSAHREYTVRLVWSGMLDSSTPMKCWGSSFQPTESDRPLQGHTCDGR
ncbi:hypothetical protein PISMIDRAFT_455800 [Pisolithus microcarpus 441]|uniref:Uncharacterized protein n=1 Tax=Pisolithus microcarpus 441 TaxID=765257 RepID=A0A0C9ZCA7_9AGAM|nr:hypothetical protein PISMIDRAFT_455800 [Pisolithus microcarpus 441]